MIIESVASAKEAPRPVMRPVATSATFRKAVIIGTYTPRLCGIATFTSDILHSLRQIHPTAEWQVVAMDDGVPKDAYPEEVTHVVPQDVQSAYRDVADSLNRQGVDVVIVQHEFGIYGGEAGMMLLDLLRQLRMPVIVHLHTVLETPNGVQKMVMDELIRLAASIIVMTETGADILMRAYGAGPAKVCVIPHGAPERPLESTAQFKPRFGFGGSNVLMTFGLLSPNKGLEVIIRGLPHILAQHPDTIYAIVGATHPHLLAHEGEAYRQRVKNLAEELGVLGHVRFLNRFCDQDELIDLLQATDIYVTPYLTEAQITSGTLSYAVALGKPVVSTPYWHARELLANGVGIICPFGDTQAFAQATIDLLSNNERRDEMARRAYRAGEPSRWRRVASEVLGLAELARSQHRARIRQRFHMLARPSLDALLAMSDDCGVLQHSTYGVADRRHGYCTDDNARALGLLARLASEGPLPPAAVRLARSCAAFVNHAWNPETGRFRNFMGFGRTWLDEGGSDDCCGRALESISLSAGLFPDQGIREWARALGNEAVRHAGNWQSLRSHALTIKALLAGVDHVHSREEATERLQVHAHALLDHAKRALIRNGEWLEPRMSYDNARLPEALILASGALHEPDMLEAGLAMLDVLMRKQVQSDGVFRPVATSSFDDATNHPQFDQQPIEAVATIDACLAAWRATGVTRYANEARITFAWFGGQNEHGLELACANSGACHDGLTVVGLNRNSGAESILSYLLAAAAIRTSIDRQPLSIA